MARVEGKTREGEQLIDELEGCGGTRPAPTPGVMSPVWRHQHSHTSFQEHRGIHH